MDHIDGTAPPASSSAEYEAWKEIDALVLQWIFSTLSDALLKRVMDSSTATAHAAWSKLEKIYLSNKKARAASLETKFCNLSLSACSSVEAYCQQLTDLANQLADVDVPVTESRLVLQLVRGLPAEFNTTAALINQNGVDWDQAVSMLQDEILRLDAQKDSHSTVLAATSSQTTPQNNQQTPSSDPNSSSTRGRGRGRGSWNRRGGRGRGNNNRQNWSGQQQQHSGFSQQPGYPNWAWWTPPPCPYPTQQQWRPNSSTGQQQTAPLQAHFSAVPQQQFSGFSPSPQGVYNALSPSDLSAAFNNMQMNQPSSSWASDVFDSGAESHVTHEQGS
uniref:Uncharacterized protein n=1 Tax=Helianthus annuus TaxID=4232 RepID=A0A251VKK5_HELAN